MSWHATRRHGQPLSQQISPRISRSVRTKAPRTDAPVRYLANMQNFPLPTPNPALHSPLSLAQQNDQCSLRRLPSRRPPQSPTAPPPTPRTLRHPTSPSPLRHSVTPSHPRSMTPPLRHSVTPSLRHFPPTPPLRHSVTPS